MRFRASSLIVLSAVEESVYQFEHLFLVAVDVCPEGLVTITAQFSDDAVYHGWAEDVVLFKYGTLLFQAVGTGFATVWQLGQVFQSVGIFLLWMFTFT